MRERGAAACGSAASNVRSGGLFLRWLLNESEGGPARAAGGCYQGLESVRREGEMPETEQYVNDVLYYRAGTRANSPSGGLAISLT